MLKRIIFILLNITLFTSLSLADSTRDLHIINDFSGGLNTQLKPDSIPNRQCMDVSDVRFNKPFGSISKREAAISYGIPGAHKVTGLHRYYATGGTQLLLTTGSTSLYLGDDDAGTFVTMETSLSDGKSWNFVNFKNLAIGMNGTDPAIKFDGKIVITDNTDGARTASNMVAELGAPFAELNTGANLDASSWYQYKVAFYDGALYTYNTARSNPILTGATVRDITLTDIPLGPSGTTTRYVYRTLGNASEANVLADNTYYKISTISDNTTRTIDDAMDDATAGADAAPTWATVSAGTETTPPKCKYPIIHEQKLFTAGNPNSPSDFYWSDTNNPDYFSPIDLDSIRANDGDEITFMKVLLSTLIVGKTNTIQKVYTETSTYKISNPFSFVGCSAPQSAVNSPIGILYLSRDGIYRFNGNNSQLISDSVTPEIRDINPIHISSAAGIFFENQYILSYTSEDSGTDYNNRVLVYDLTRDSYTKDLRNISVFEVLDSGTDMGILATGSSSTDGTIYLVGSSGNILIKKLKSEFDIGTFDDSRVYNTETNPIIELGWDIVIDDAVGTINAQVGDINRTDTDGTWTSPVYQVNSSELTSIKWNEDLASSGDITFQIRTGATTPVDGTWTAWSTAVTNPTGSDLTGLTADTYIQLRANLTTDDIDETPILFLSNNFVLRIDYNKSGQTLETDISSLWESGWTDFGNPRVPKLIENIRVYYKGTSGTITVSFENQNGDFSDSFDIELNVNPPSDSDDDGTREYQGTDNFKYYTYYMTSAEDGSYPVGDSWRFNITDTDTNEWQIDRIEILYTVEQDYD